MATKKMSKEALVEYLNELDTKFMELLDVYAGMVDMKVYKDNYELRTNHTNIIDIRWLVNKIINDEIIKMKGPVKHPTNAQQYQGKYELLIRKYKEHVYLVFIKDVNGNELLKETAEDYEAAIRLCTRWENELYGDD